jgi:seryl-tRNA synthetase
MACDIAKEKGFTLLDPPVIVQEEYLYGTGHFPTQREEIFEVKDNDNIRFLVGTSEVPLMGYYANEILQEKDFPIKLAALTPCFRTEVGSYGKDTKGLYRVRQFYKMEQLIITKKSSEESKRHFDELIDNAETILQKLELPYRIIQKCTGDMGQGKAEEWDIEAWMPSRMSFGETHTCSELKDFQARRLQIRYKDENNTMQYVYTLNNTLIASPRILIPFLETHQQEDGSITIPKALQPYLKMNTIYNNEHEK